MKTEYRILDHEGNVKPVRTFVGAQRVAKRMAKACALRSGQPQFVTIQKHRGTNNWCDIETVNSSRTPLP